MEKFLKFTKDYDVAILVTDTDFCADGPHILYANEKFEEMTGYKLDEFIGSTPRFFHGPDTNSEQTKEIIDCIRHGKYFEGVRLIYKKNGTELLRNWTVETVTIDGENYIFCQQRDLSICLIDALDKVKTLQRSILSKIPEQKNALNYRKSISGTDAETFDFDYVKCYCKSNFG